MPRVKRGPKRKNKRAKTLALAKGYYGTIRPTFQVIYQRRIVTIMTSGSALPPAATVGVTADYLESMRQQLEVFEERYGVPSGQMLDVPAFRLPDLRGGTIALEIYNALNNNVVLTENQTFGSSLGQPLSILQPRVLRISTQLKF